MTRKEAERLTHQQDVLQSLGFTRQEAESLRRISMTLHRWAEHECNGAIQRDGDNGDGAPYWYSTHTGRRICKAPDRERGAIKRLDAIMAAHADRIGITADGSRMPNGKLAHYVQGDPRGCALYILRPGDVPDGADVGAYYTRGIAVY